MSDDGNDDSSCDVVSVVECIVAPVGLASHGGIINFSGVNIAPSDCVCATQHERCLSPLKVSLVGFSDKTPTCVKIKQHFFLRA